ncbi:MAG: asparaginase [Oscillospiraceae bacterium]|nr:asparaginase [Oscillospiraceae bacterium]
MKSVLLITTGGTIAARDSGDGLKPNMSSQELLHFVDGLTGLYDITTKELLNLDSSNIQVDEWIIIARAIYEALDKYDGIVVTHGTDTMAYTASMVSFMLKGLKKPVVFTGSQMPIENLLTDARNNLYTAFAAVECGIPGVTVAFDRKIIAGCRAVKVRTMGFEAFESVNAGYMGEVFADGMRPHVIPPTPEELAAPVELLDNVCRDVFLLKLIPGINPDVLHMLRSMNYRGIVIEAFGAGGMQFVRTNMLEHLKELTDAGISVVVCSQCLYETSNLAMYEVGTKLLACGVIPAGDMTTEAVVTKLMWALGQTDDPQKVRDIFNTDYCGEIKLSD